MRETDTVTGGYYEFHFKCRISKSADYFDIQRICRELNAQPCHVFLGFNTTKKAIEPIVTLRVTQDGFWYRELVAKRLAAYVTHIHNEYVSKL